MLEIAPLADVNHLIAVFFSSLASLSASAGTTHSTSFNPCPREGEYLNVRASPQKAADLRVMGEATNVFPREDSGWYVPPLPEAAAKSEAVPVKQTLHSAFGRTDGLQCLMRLSAGGPFNQCFKEA